MTNEKYGFTDKATLKAWRSKLETHNKKLRELLGECLRECPEDEVTGSVDEALAAVELALGTVDNRIKNAISIKALGKAND